MLVSSSTVVRGSVVYRLDFYRNDAYRCGRTGTYTFLVVEKQSQRGQLAPLWVLLHGGGTGYYAPDGGYHPGNEAQNDENGAGGLAALVGAAFDAAGQPRDTVTGRRVADGHRFLAVSMCDHDLYGGLGNPYPNNPNWGAAGDRVEGLLATMAAVHFTARGGPAADGGLQGGYPTSRVFLQGSSAGSVGAHHVSAGFAHNGVLLNGAVLDGYVMTSRQLALFDAGCTPLNADPQFDPLQLAPKIGPFVSEPSLLLQSVAGTPGTTPFVDLYGERDPHCCGDAPATPLAADAGFTNNCRWIHDLVEERLREHPTPTSTVVCGLGLGHVIGADPGPHQAAVEQWYQGVIASNPKAPVFP